MKHLTWILIAGAALTAAACGQKGPLYLPEHTGTVVTRPAQPPAAPAPQNNPPQGSTQQNSSSSQSSSDSDSPNKPQDDKSQPPR